MSDSVELKLEAPRLTPNRFERIVEQLFVLVEGVTKNISGEAKDEDWIVEVSEGSVVLRARAVNQRSAAAVGMVLDGLRSLESGVRSAPPFFTKAEIEAAKALAGIIDDDAKFIKGISFRNGEAPFHISKETVKSADAILAGESQIMFGSFEGFIDAFHHKEGQPFTCTINDPLYKRRIVCSFTNPESEEVAYKAFRPPKRVLVYGLIRYAKEGYPMRIDVNMVRVFPEESDLPSLEEIQSFYSK